MKTEVNQYVIKYVIRNNFFFKCPGFRYTCTYSLGSLQLKLWPVIHPKIITAIGPWDREKMGSICLILSPQYIKSIVLSQKNLTFDHQRKSLYPNDCSHENGAPLGTMQTILFFSILLLIHFLIYLIVYGTSSFYT